MPLYSLPPPRSVLLAHLRDIVRSLEQDLIEAIAVAERAAASAERVTARLHEARALLNQASGAAPVLSGDAGQEGA